MSDQRTLNGISNTDIVWIGTVKDEFGNKFDLTDPSDWTVTAQLYDLCANTAVGSSAAQTNANGADWVNGKVSVVMPASATSALAAGNYGLEIKATNGGQLKRWHLKGRVELKKGIIA